MSDMFDRTSRFGNSGKASSRRPKPGGLYRGTVTRDNGGIFVLVASVNPAAPFGPCTVFGPYPKKDDVVLCAFLDNKFDELVVIGKETKTKVLKYVDTPTANTDGSNKLYVDTEITTLKSYVDQQIANL